MLLALPGLLSASLSWPGDDFEQNEVGGQAHGWGGYRFLEASGQWRVVQDDSKSFSQSDAAAVNAWTSNGFSAGFAPDCTVRLRVKITEIGDDGSVDVVIGTIPSGGCLFVGYGCTDGFCGFHIIDGFHDSLLAFEPEVLDTGVWYNLDIRVHEVDVDFTVSTTDHTQSQLMSLAARNSETPYGEIGLQTSYAAASFDDIVVTGRDVPDAGTAGIVAMIALLLAVSVAVIIRARRAFAVIFFTALILRLMFFAFMTAELDSPELASHTPDVCDYTHASELIREGFDFESRGVDLFGPGYPAVLAVVGFVLGANPILPILLQILLSSLGAMFLAALAFKLTRDIRIAFVAGLLNAVSFTSISLANVLLSETVFFMLIVLGFLAFVTALDCSRRSYFVLAALCIGMASLVRSMGLFLFAPLLLIAAVHYWRHDRGSWRTLFRGMVWPVIAAVIILCISGLWTVRNWGVHDSPHMAVAGPVGMAKVYALAQSEISGKPYLDEYLRFHRDLQEHTDYRVSRYKAFDEQSAELLLTLICDHPATVAKVFLMNVNENINNDVEAFYQLPQFREMLGRMKSLSDKKGLNYRISLLGLIGVATLLWRRRFGLAIVLVSVLAYFAILSGFTVWEGVRIFYPGQIAWAILVAYPLLWIFDAVARKLGSVLRRTSNCLP